MQATIAGTQLGLDNKQLNLAKSVPSGLPVGILRDISGNSPDVTADIVDIHVSFPVSADCQRNRVDNEDPYGISPDYPMDSLPRQSGSHTGISNLPSSSGVVRTSQTSNQSRMNVDSRTIVSTSDTLRTSQTSNSSTSNANTRHIVSSGDIVQPVSRSLSSSVRNVAIPVLGTTAAPIRIPISLHPHLYSSPHSSHATSAPVVSVSNINVNVSNGATPVAVAGASNSRRIQTHNLDVGIVSRLDHHQQCANILPDIVAHSQSPATQQPIPRVSTEGVHSRTSPVQRLADSHSHRQHRHNHRNGHSHRQHSASIENPCKESCMKCLAVATSFRWILVVLSLLGVCCVVSGIVLAALTESRNSYLFLAIMFIGLGVLLVVVVVVGWKCTPRGREPIHALCNLGNYHHRDSRRHRLHHRRDRGWHGGPVYADFQYHRPPPSYNDSMQEYQQQIALVQQSLPNDIYDPNHIPEEDYSLPSSPPPSYRSRASTVRAAIQITFPPNRGSDNPESRPPTYRSNPANTLPGRHRRPSLTRDSDHNSDPAPADVAFTGSSFIVDTNISPNSSSIHISPSLVSNQNVTVSVTTVSVSSNQSVPSPFVTVMQDQASAETLNSVDPVGEDEADKVDTAF